MADESGLVASGLAWPEGPVALADGTFLAVEIEGRTLARIAVDGTVTRIASPGGGPNGAAIGPDGAVYICNAGGDLWVEHDGMRLPMFDAASYSGGRIERCDLATGEIRVLFTECDGYPLNAPNDLVFDSDGGMWFTDFGKRRGRHADVGAIYYARVEDGTIREVLPGLASPNGIGLSPDERTLYYSETFTGRVWHYPLAGAGTLAIPPAPLDPSRLLYSAPGLRLLDSMAIDTAGNLHVATMIEGGISVISPEGDYIDFRPMPDPITTNICFGGPDRKTAFVTLSSRGELISYPVETPGLALPFAGHGAAQ